ncbi:MAG TPA: signal peptidase I [Terriglobales bacterium]|nr:signal peptidase I [Terriglobales bacterium]
MTIRLEAPPVPAISAPKAAHRHSGWAFLLQSFLVVIVIAVFAITFVVQAFQIPSDSMENTLLVGDYLLVDKLCYGANPGADFMPYRPVKRGDIIVFKFPVDPTQHFVKRVVGIPGDRVRLINRTVYVNGIALREPYTHHISSVTDDFRDNFPQLNLSVAGLEGKWWLQMKTLVKDNELIVPPDNYFVLGDNRDDSEDSRYWGFVPRANIVGRPLIVYWSMREAGSDGAPATPNDRLLHLAYGITHFYQITRWNRTFLVVR